ncbi:MAG: DUF4160 domain-containing protein [Synergistaceae bacterium]|nr:DUF4160 domain-containing protein [Synergistaceae bacterium]
MTMFFCIILKYCSKLYIRRRGKDNAGNNKVLRNTNHDVLQGAYFHAWYSGHKAEFDFEGNILAGEMPSKQSKMIAAWLLCTQMNLL